MTNVLTEAHCPDSNRAGPHAPGRLQERLTYLLCLLALFVLERMLGFRARPADLAWLHDRPDLPLASAQALAASVRGSFGTAIAWMCRRSGILPGHPDWPYVSRAIVAFGGSLEGLHAGAARCPQQWWENPDIIPGMTRAPAAPVIATASQLSRASLLLRRAVAESRLPVAETAPAGHAPAALAPAGLALAVSPEPRLRVLARLGTGPPTGPPTVPDDALCCLTNGAGPRPAPPP